MIAAPLFLAAGIAAESYVVLGKITEDKFVIVAYAAASFAVLIGFWYALPLAVRWTGAMRKG